MISIWNYLDAPQDLMLTLFYFGGQYRIPLHLEARKTYNLDMMELFSRHMPDIGGNILLSNVVTGSALLSGPKGDSDTISVASSSAIYNVRNATCSPGCIYCNGVTSTTVSPDSITVPSSTTYQATITQTWNTGIKQTFKTGKWSTGDSTVATVNSSGLLTGTAPGATAVTAVVPQTPIPGDACPNLENDTCPIAPIAEGSGSVSVPPTLSCTPVTRGQVTTCTAAGGTGATYSGWQFSGSDGNTVTSSNTSSTWSGIAAISGTVSVTVSNGESE